MKTLNEKILEYYRSKNTGIVFLVKYVHGSINEFLFNMQVFILSLIKKQRNKVVATAYRGKKFGDNPRFIIEKIHKLSPVTEIVWITNSQFKGTIPDYIRTIPYENRKKVILELATASVVVENNRCFNNLIRCSNQLRIETWHGGLGFKSIGMDVKNNNEATSKRSNNTYDFFISNSNHITKVYRTSFGYKGPVWKCGYPIEDRLSIEDKSSCLIHKEFSISDNVHIALYAPTYRSQYLWTSSINALDITNALQNRFGGEWVLAVHWHHNMPYEQRFLAGSIDVTGFQDIQILLEEVDVCISDYSSSIFMAVQKGIPSFVFADDYEKYKEKHGLYLSIEEQPFPCSFNNEELINSILSYDRIIWNEKWNEYSERMGHTITGHSAEDIAKVCVDFLNGKSKKEIMKEIPFETDY